MDSRDLARIRFVTRHQDELRGLHTAVFGLWMVALLAMSSYAPFHRRGASLAFFMVVMTLPNILHEIASRWYAARIGRVGSGRRPFLRTRLAWALLFGGIALDALGVTPVAGHSGLLVLLAGYSLWVAVRDFPFRAYHLVALVLIAAAPPVTEATSIMVFPQYALAGAWFLVSGLADHCLLVTCIKRMAAGVAAAADTIGEAAQ